MANEVAKTKKRKDDEFSKAFKEATVEYDEKKGKESAADVCLRVGRKHNLSPTRQGKLTAHRIREAVKEKRIGVSPLKPGRASAVPKAVLKAAAMQMGINQTNGVEMGRKHGAMLVRGALAGTPFASAAAERSKKKSLRLGGAHRARKQDRQLNAWRIIETSRL